VPRTSSGCVAHLRQEGSGTHVRIAARLLVVLLALTASLLAPAAALAGTEPRPDPERCVREGEGPRRCVGPVVDESGGGGDALTIVVGVVVGLGIAVGAFFIVRRQLASTGSSSSTLESSSTSESPTASSSSPSDTAPTP